MSGIPGHTRKIDQYHDIPSKPWDTVCADIFMLNNKRWFCILDHHSTFPVLRLTDGLSTDSLTITYIIIFSEYESHRKIMSDAGTNFVSERFQAFMFNRPIRGLMPMLKRPSLLFDHDDDHILH